MSIYDKIIACVRGDGTICRHDLHNRIYYLQLLRMRIVFYRRIQRIVDELCNSKSLRCVKSCMFPLFFYDINRIRIKIIAPRILSFTYKIPTRNIILGRSQHQSIWISDLIRISKMRGLSQRSFNDPISSKEIHTTEVSWPTIGSFIAIRFIAAWPAIHIHMCFIISDRIARRKF